MLRPRKKEEEAIVLDFLQHGYPFDNRPSHRKTPIVQAIGVENFTLLELVPKKGVFCKPLDRVYIGSDKREQIHHINRRLKAENLTQTAKTTLSTILEELVSKKEQQFVDFFNTAPPLGTRMHSLELLPGVGKKHMQEIITAREEKPFTSFEDIKSRAKTITDPKKLIISRIMQEFEGKEKHYLFIEQ